MKQWRMLRMVAALTAAVMLAVMPAALADTTVAGVQELGRNPDLNEATNTYIMRLEDRSYALFSAAGEQLTEGYAYMSAKSGGRYLTVVNEDGVNTMGLLDRDGKMLLPMQYGQIEVQSEKWIMGVVLETTDGEPYDYRALLGGDLYRIVTVDVYYEGTLLGTLEREDYANSNVRANGSYLTVRRVDGSGFYLNAAFERTDGESVSTYEYENDYRGNMTHNATGQKAFVSGCTLTADEVDLKMWYNDDGDFVNLQGELISHGPTEGKEYNSVYFDGGSYLRTRSNDGYGLVTAEGVEVLPAVYDAIGGTSEGTYFLSGYQVVLKGGKLSYLDMAGNETASVEYQMSDSDYRGFYSNAPFVTVDAMGQKVVITALAGELPQRYQDAGYPQAGERILAVKKDDLWGVIDLLGNEVIPFELRSQPNISDDGTLVAGMLAEGGYRLYTIAYDAAE